jgi:hypothetical protein
MVSRIYPFKVFTLRNACSRTRQSRAADVGVVTVGKHMDNFTVINSEAERLAKLNSQRLV